MRPAHRVLAGKPEGNEPLGRPRRNKEDRTEINLTEVGVKGVGWIDLAHDWEKLSRCYERY